MADAMLFPDLIGESGVKGRINLQILIQSTVRIEWPAIISRYIPFNFIEWNTRETNGRIYRDVNDGTLEIKGNEKDSV